MFPSDAGVDNLSRINEEVQIITRRKSAREKKHRPGNTKKVYHYFLSTCIFPGFVYVPYIPIKCHPGAIINAILQKQWVQKLRKSKN